jgi:hypothetical protein
MICSSINDRNIVDDSVKAIINTVPNIVRTSYAIFEKYGKLIDQKYDQLIQSDEKRRVKNVSDTGNIRFLTFDKLLFALDRDLYIDFMNEIGMVNGGNAFIPYDYSRPTKDIEEEKDMHNVKLSSIYLNYLVHPSVSLKRLSGYNYDIKKTVPLIKVQPRFRLQKATDEYSFLSFGMPYTNEESRNYGVGISCEFADSFIDITSLFEIFRAHFASHQETTKFQYAENRFVEEVSKLREFPLDLHGLNSLSEEILSNIAGEIIDIVSKKITYSLTVSYLAMLGKLERDKQNGLVSIFTDILDSCRKTVLGSYDSTGEELKTGMSLRHMTVDISTLFNAITKNPNDYSEAMNKEFNMLRSMIEYAFEIKYCTYNYIKVPGDNLKHKKLAHISQMAKPQVCFLNGDTRADLQCCIANTDKVEVPLCFCEATDIKVDGTYAYTKRLYDCTKDFIDVFAKLIIIKKRMHDAGGFNVSDGTVDPIGKRSIDYKSYLKHTYDELEVTLSNIYNRIRSVVIGKRYLTNNLMVKNSPEESIRNLNTIIYGINTESALDEDYYGNDIEDLYPYRRVDYNQNKDESFCCRTNNRIADIRGVYNVLKERECSYINNSQDLLTAVNSFGNGPLIAFWIAVTECTGDYFDAPYKHIVGNINDFVGGYGESSINDMSQKGEIITDHTEPFDWHHTGFEDKYISVEDLSNRVQDLKEKLDENDSESVFGGLLFGDFCGIPLAQEMTAKETEIFNDQLTVRKIPNEEVEAFESVKHDFDRLLAKHF